MASGENAAWNCGISHFLFKRRLHRISAIKPVLELTLGRGISLLGDLALVRAVSVPKAEQFIPCFFNRSALRQNFQSASRREPVMKWNSQASTNETQQTGQKITCRPSGALYAVAPPDFSFAASQPSRFR